MQNSPNRVLMTVLCLSIPLIHGCSATPKPEAQIVIVPRIVDLAPTRCPEPSAEAKAEANKWVQRLKPAENNRFDLKNKLDEFSLSQVKKNAAITALVKDNEVCRNGGKTTS